MTIAQLRPNRCTFQLGELVAYEGAGVHIPIPFAGYILIEPAVWVAVNDGRPVGIMHSFRQPTSCDAGQSRPIRRWGFTTDSRSNPIEVSNP